MALYRSNFLVEAEPMMLGFYCTKHGWLIGQSRFNEEGYAIKYQPSQEPGWVPKELFEASYKQVEVIEE